MKILFLGDVAGRSGREAVEKHLPKLQEIHEPDFTIVNVDNASSGRGATQAHAREILGYGANLLTGGDHIWDQHEMIVGVENIKRLLRPANLPEGTPGKGVTTIDVDGQKITVIHLGGTVFMSHSFDSPFDCVDKILNRHRLSAGHHIFVDFHAEATSEKMALAHYLDGRVSAVIGTHTHVPTADTQILHDGTAYQTDAGMCGDYNSVIGVKIHAPIQNFRRKVPRAYFKPADGEATVCGTLIETSNQTGQAKRIVAVRVGGGLSDTPFVSGDK